MPKYMWKGGMTIGGLQRWLKAFDSVLDKSQVIQIVGIDDEPVLIVKSLGYVPTHHTVQMEAAELHGTN